MNFLIFARFLFTQRNCRNLHTVRLTIFTTSAIRIVGGTTNLLAAGTVTRKWALEEAPNGVNGSERRQRAGSAMALQAQEVVAITAHKFRNCRIAHPRYCIVSCTAEYQYKYRYICNCNSTSDWWPLTFWPWPCFISDSNSLSDCSAISLCCCLLLALLPNAGH